MSRDATAEQIQQAYRRLARKHHPDINKDPGAEERFKEVNEAYHVLSDPKTRERYDRFGEDFRRVPEDYDERASAGGGGFRGAGIDIDDLLSGIFGGVGGFGPVPGADQEAELELTLEEAYRGGSRRRDLPPGITEGQRIRLPGEGARGSRNAPPGDLYLVVHIAPHPRFRLDGRDISTDLLISPWEAVLGATVAVHTPAGEAKVKVPPGSSTGRRLRLRGEGMPNPRGSPGDLYAEIKIMVPAKPTPRERELFEQLAAESRFDPRRAR